jgi:hypothetical protein
MLLVLGRGGTPISLMLSMWVGYLPLTPARSGAYIIHGTGDTSNPGQLVTGVPVLCQMVGVRSLLIVYHIPGVEGNATVLGSP